MKRAKILIDKEFLIEHNNCLVTIKLTSHLFLKRVIRKQQSKQIRSFMFKSRAQYVDFFQYLFEKHTILTSYKGKLAIVFNFLSQKFGMLIDIKKIDLENTYDITVITIDKIDSRHFYISDIFKKEKNKIYVDFNLQPSYLHAIDIKVDTVSEFQIFRSFYFNNVAGFYHFDNYVDLVRLNNSLISNFHNSTLQYGTQWIVISANDKTFYIRISIEKLLSGNSFSKALIFIDIKNSFHKAKERANYNKEKIISLKKNNGDFRKLFSDNNKQTGLKIKKKSTTI